MHEALETSQILLDQAGFHIEGLAWVAARKDRVRLVRDRGDTSHVAGRGSRAASAR